MDCCLLKSDQWHVCLIVCGDKLDHDFDAGYIATSLFEIKLLINSVISDAHRGASFMSLNLKDHFLASHMLDAELVYNPSSAHSSGHHERKKLIG